ncbi:MAG TPA: coenzyme F420-0:L-glutamate ligase [Candidatus Paceibacterota bacterium]|nr:coenzyme F420-0:L-glutamate ligase [Candidatus Paceibacterota bacterium]
MFEPNHGKTLDLSVEGELWLRLPVKTRVIEPGDDLEALIEEYVAPHLEAGDLLFVSEKVVCICQRRLVPFKEIRPGRLARLLAAQVDNRFGTPEFHGFGHGTALGMQLLIEEAGYLRTLGATAVGAATRPLGIRGAFYYLVGKRAKSVDCPMSFSIVPYTHYAKRSPQAADALARRLKERFGAACVIVDSNYRGAFSLGRSSKNISERFIRGLMRDNPAGQSDEMTPFIIARRA